MGFEDYAVNRKTMENSQEKNTLVRHHVESHLLGSAASTDGRKASVIEQHVQLLERVVSRIGDRISELEKRLSYILREPVERDHASPSPHAEPAPVTCLLADQLATHTRRLQQIEAHILQIGSRIEL